ncbi:MAG: efflux RND transporter permease subunit [Hyphomicrobiaceae bacterium]
MTSTAPEQSPMPPDDGGWVGTFIRRPVLTIVLNLLIIIAGYTALQGIEIRELPDVDRPIVTVRATYEGATPQTMDAQITAIIESAVSRVQGVSAISSNSSYGSSRVTIEFSSNTKLDAAAMDVRDAVAAIRGQLPADMRDDPSVVKADADASPIMRLVISAEKLSEAQLTDLVNNVIEDRLAAVEGVASATSFGLRARTIEVRVNQVALAGRGLALSDLMSAIGKASITGPSGALDNPTQQLLVKAEAPIQTPEEVGALELNATTRVSDVAFVRWGYQEATAITRHDGRTAVGMEIIRQAQSNTIGISEGVRAAIDELKHSLPQGVDISIISDDAVFIEEAVHEVVVALIIAGAIVVIVILLFLASIHATIAPTIAIPISLIGTLAAIWMAGFSLNIITLLALVVATGLVVDDAIIVIENISRHRALGAGPRAAAVIGTREIVFAVLATTATLVAVFIPVSFMPGVVGSLFSEFGFVMAFSVIVSSFVALTLCPMLAAKIGTGHHAAETATPGRFGRVAAAFGGFYGRALDWCLSLRWLVVAGCLAFGAAAYIAFRLVPSEITPTEDRSVININISAQQGSNLEYVSRKVALVESVLDELKKKGEITSVLTTVGRGGANRATIVAPLAPWRQRSRSQQDIQAELQAKFAEIPGLSISTRSPNSLGIRGGGQGLRFAVTGNDYAKISDGATALAQRLSQTPGFRTVRTDFETTQPQLSVRIDREAATKLGVPIDAITSLINTMVDYSKAADLFIGEEIVEVQIKPGGRPINDPSDLNNLFVKTGNGRFVALSTLVKMEEVAIAPTLARESRRRAVPVSAQLAEGTYLSDAVNTLRTIAPEVLGSDMSITLLGEAKTLSETSQSTTFVFATAFLIVFLVLAAQFESVVSALVIMVTVPFGLAAAIFAILLTGGSLNVYSQIGLVLLVGVMAKNGILMVEFADQRRDEGWTVAEAIRTAATTRLRPVMMTALAAVVGAFPLVIATGAGSEARLALGWVIIGGLGFATIFTLFLVPVAYRILAPLAKPRAHETQILTEELKAAPKPV